MERLDLTTYLMPGVDVYSVIHQSKKKVIKIDHDSDMPIVIGSLKARGEKYLYFNKCGSVLKNGTECLLFPDKDTTTWEGYVAPATFKLGDVVKAFSDGITLVAIYSHFDNSKQKHCCFHSVSPSGEIIFGEYENVGKFEPSAGYLHAKQAYSVTLIGRFNKYLRLKDSQDSNLQKIDSHE